MKKCLDTSIPAVDDTSIECCGVTPSNCVLTSEPDSYLKIFKGETLTNVIHIISNFLKNINKAINYKEYVAIVNQTTTDPPTLFQISNTLNVIFTPSYEGVGFYKLTASAPIFTVGETYVTCSSPSPQTYLIEVEVLSTTEITLHNYCHDSFICGAIGDAVDNVMINAPLMIRVKN